MAVAAARVRFVDSFPGLTFAARRIAFMADAPLAQLAEQLTLNQ
jgi:hypothetical protein